MDQVDVNKLWQNFLDTVTNHYMDFNGRVGRAQFWWYILVVFVLAFGVGIVAGVVHLYFLSQILSLALLLPNLGMMVRRLHDSGKPGIWVLILAIPAAIMIVLGLLVVVSGGLLFGLLFLIPVVYLAALVAAVVMIYFCVQPGDPAANTYGPPPPPFASGKPATPAT